METKGDNSETFFDSLERDPRGVQVVMNLRNDIATLLASIKAKQLKFEHPLSSISECDNHLRKWLKAVFCLSSLRLQRIAFESSSGNVLQYVASGESVHRVRSLKELKRRLHDGRRCVGLFHQCMPENPVVFIHIALTSQLAHSLM
jgi:malonyl-CoA decarboxylase